MAVIQGELLDEGGWAINFRAIGIVGDGSTDRSAALGTLAAGQYVVPAGSYRIKASTTIPEGVSLRFARGAVFKTDANVTVTFQHLPEAGTYRIFDDDAGGRFVLAEDSRAAAVSIDWWGPNGSDRWDDALRKAMRAVVSGLAGGPVGMTAEVRFGRGIYRFATSGAFNQISALPIRRGLVFRGAGPQNTLLYLCCEGVETTPMWFYDGVDKNGRYYFYDLGFSSDDHTRGSLFRHESTASGEEKEFHYYNCAFGDVAHSAFGISGDAGLFEGFRYQGTTNADLNKWVGCRFAGFKGGLLHFDNNQSVSHAMYACDFELTGTFATTHAQAGGDVKVYAGTLRLKRRPEVNPADPPSVFVVDHEDSTSLWPGNNTFVFHGVRFEFHEGCSIVRKQGESGSSNTVFRDCDMYVSGSVRRGVEINHNGFVLFDRTNIPSTILTYYALPHSGIASAAGTCGIILFTNCDVPASLHELAFVDPWGYGGRVVAEGCYHHTRNVTQADRASVDFDKGWENAAVLDRRVARKTAVLKRKISAWPHSGSSGEHTLILPAGAMIVGVRVKKPASGSNGDTYRLHVGSDDKGTTYGSSTSSTIADEHTITGDNLWIECGSSLNTRTVRLWMTGTATEAQPKIGYAVVEYI